MSKRKLVVEQLESRIVPDGRVYLDLLPDDPQFGALYGLRQINAPEAWDVTTGSTAIAVAVVDTGVDYTHPDLYLNIWINNGEIPDSVAELLVDTDGDGVTTFRDLNQSVNIGPGKITDLDGDGRITGADILRPISQGGWANGVNEDGNVYQPAGFTQPLIRFIDDLIGWDFNDTGPDSQGEDTDGVDSDGDGFDDDPQDVWDNKPMDKGTHGTHVAGTIGATGNNSTGVVGVNWKTQIIPLSFMDSSGSGQASNVIAATYYAVGVGAQISNWSFGGGSSASLFNLALDHAEANGHLVVISAGNDGHDLDQNPDYPASSTQPNTIVATATNGQEGWPSWANWGANTVDIAAPGDSILSTLPGGGYGWKSGTSMSAPHVAGAAALLWGQHPDWTYVEVKNQLLSTARETSVISPFIVSGILDVGAALEEDMAIPGVVTSDGSWNGFPYLAIGDGGTRIIEYRKSTGHDTGTGIIVAKTSVGGAWSAETTVVSEAGRDYSGGRTRLADGTWLHFGSAVTVVASGSNPMFADSIKTWKSVDGWTLTDEVTLDFQATQWVVGIDTPLELDNGDIVLAVYGKDVGESGWFCSLLRSIDGGLSWGDEVEIVDAGLGEASEPCLVDLGGGNVRALVRLGNQILQVISTDYGETWGSPTFAFDGTGKPFVMVLPDGRLLSIYRSVNGGHVAYRFSDGVWSEERILADAPPGGTMVYADAVLLPGNETVAIVYGLQVAASTPASIHYAERTIASLEGPDVPADGEAYTLDQYYGFFSTGNLFQNYGGQNEKWFQGQAGVWYFIKPDGSVWEWDNQTSQATGTLLAMLTSWYWDDPARLYHAPPDGDGYDLDQLHGFHSNGNLYLNYGGQQEKWFQDDQGQWFFILPDGQVKLWDGIPNSATGTLVATVHAGYYADPSLLYNAQPFEE